MNRQNRTDSQTRACDHATDAHGGLLMVVRGEPLSDGHCTSATLALAAIGAHFLPGRVQH